MLVIKPKQRALTWAAVLLACIALVGFAHVPILREIGSFLIVEDSLKPAAAIIALGGQTPFREMEAARLYRAGWAPVVVLVPGLRREEALTLKQLGIIPKEGWEVSREVLIHEGVPAASVVVSTNTAEGTLEELQAAYAAVSSEVSSKRPEVRDQRSAVSRREAQSITPVPDFAFSAVNHSELGNSKSEIPPLPVILVTSKYHTRRTRLTWDYVTGGRSQAIVRAASRDPFDPRTWWHKRQFVLSVVREYMGLANYYAGFPVAP